MSKQHDMKMLFTNFYECPECGYGWEDDWDCQPDDDCPNCGKRHISPYDSKDIEYDINGNRIFGVRPKIVIVIQGGIVAHVYTSDPSVAIEVYDFDVVNAMCHPSNIIQSDFTPQVLDERVETLLTEAVNKALKEYEDNAAEEF